MRKKQYTYLRWFVTLLASIILLTNELGMSLNLDLDSDFDTNTLSDKEIESIWKNIDVKCVYEDKKVETSIVSFDVSDMGKIAIAFHDNKIKILDDDGNFINRFEFKTEGAYYVGWDEENLLIFFERSSLITEITEEGNLVQMVDCDEKSWENSVRWREIRRKNVIEVNNEQYEMINDMGFFNLFAWGGFAKLQKVKNNGEIVILYDVKESYRRNIIVIFSITTIFLVIAIYGLTKLVINTVKELKSGQYQFRKPEKWTDIFKEMFSLRR